MPSAGAGPRFEASLRRGRSGWNPARRLRQALHSSAGRPVGRGPCRRRRGRQAGLGA